MGHGWGQPVCKFRVCANVRAILANVLSTPGEVGVAVASIVDRDSPAVIHLEVSGNEAPGGSGSGFFISPDGYALTNSHVVSRAREIRAALAEGRLPC